MRTRGGKNNGICHLSLSHTSFEWGWGHLFDQADYLRFVLQIWVRAAEVGLSEGADQMAKAENTWRKQGQGWGLYTGEPAERQDLWSLGRAGGEGPLLWLVRLYSGWWVFRKSYCDPHPFAMSYIKYSPESFGIECLLCQAWPQGRNEQAPFPSSYTGLCHEKATCSTFSYTSQRDNMKDSIWMEK